MSTHSMRGFTSVFSCFLFFFCFFLPIFLFRLLFLYIHFLKGREPYKEFLISKAGKQEFILNNKTTGRHYIRRWNVVTLVLTGSVLYTKQIGTCKKKYERKQRQLTVFLFGEKKNERRKNGIHFHIRSIFFVDRAGNKERRKK